MFSIDTRIREITSQPEFSGYEYMTGKFPGIGGAVTGMMKLKTLSKIAGWIAPPIADSMDYLIQRAKEGKVFYDIYSEEEKAADPSKKTTGIVALTLKKKSKFVVVCAGGCYASVCSMPEAFPIIKDLNDMGYAAFSMQYRCGKDAAAPAPMDDLAQAVRFILDHADEFNVEKEGYAVMGFSAGGHLAASFGTESLGYAHYGLPAPAALILSYPVITMGDKTHAGSKNNLIGKNADAAAVKLYSIEEQVTEKYPPSYVWQFDHDKLVPCDNSRMIVEAMKAKGVACEYETFPGDIHGAGVGKGTVADGWLKRAVAFWEVHR